MCVLSSPLDGGRNEIKLISNLHFRALAIDVGHWKTLRSNFQSRIEKYNINDVLKIYMSFHATYTNT